MKKVVYSIKKVRGNSDDKISGLRFLNEEGTLLISNRATELVNAELIYN